MNDKAALDRWSNEASQGRRLRVCLCIDLMGSTAAGIEMPSSVLDRFNETLIRQIQPHLKALGLHGEDIKFVGDGWLLWIDATDTLKVRAACCLARIMALRFQVEMAQATDLAVDKIPPLRQSLCCGEDLPVYLDDLRREWVGDSARRAVRASGWCGPNEVLIDEPVRYIVFRDFYVTDADLANRPPERRPKREEEKIPLHVLGNLKDGVADAPGAPEVYMVLGSLTAQRLVQEGLQPVASNEAALEHIKAFIEFVRSAVEERAVTRQWPQSVFDTWRYWTDISLSEQERSALGVVLQSAGIDEQDKIWEFLADKASLGLLKRQFANAQRFPDFAVWQTLKDLRNADQIRLRDSGVYGVVVPRIVGAPGSVIRLAVVIEKSSEDNRDRSPRVVFTDLEVTTVAQRAAEKAVEAAESWLGWKGVRFLAAYTVMSPLFGRTLLRAFRLAAHCARLTRSLQGAQVCIISELVSGPPPQQPVDGTSLGLAVFFATLVAVSREKLRRLLRLLPRLLDIGFSGGVDRGRLDRDTDRIPEKLRAFDVARVRRVVFPCVPEKERPDDTSGLEVSYHKTTREVLQTLSAFPRKFGLAINLCLLLILWWSLYSGWKHFWPRPEIATIAVASSPRAAGDYLIRGIPLEVTRASQISMKIAAGLLEKDVRVVVRSGRVDKSGHGVNVLKYAPHETSPLTELQPTIRDGMVSFVYSNPDPTIGTDVLVIEVQCLGRIDAYYGLNLRILGQGEAR